MNRFVSLLLAAGVSCLAPPAKAASFKIGAHTFTLPDGFTVELVASAPLVERPISIAFDERGRLHATDSSGSNEKGPTQYERKDHRIVRLEDTDGDGRFDKSVVFADKMMFPEGALWLDGSLHVAAPPQIWKLTDTDGDGVADKREVWHDGQTLTGCANDLHGPYLGRDGWIYWCKGAFAEQRCTLPNGRPFVTRAAHIFRARPDGTGLEPVLTGGMDNPVGVAFSSTGERFLSCTFVEPGGGRRDGLLHAIYGGVYGKDHDVLTGHPRTGDLMPVMTHMGAAAPCGLTTYNSRGFGDDFRDNLFACYFNLHKVVRHELIPDGATFKTKDTDFVVSDNVDFHPTDVLEDADGSLLIVDTGGWYKICCPTSQLAKPDVLGGIYRVRKTGAPKLKDPRGLRLAWAKMNPTELAELLGDERLYVRQRAIHELGKKGSAADSVLNEVVTQAKSVEARQNAVWTLTRLGGRAAREAVRTALNDTEPSVVHTAMHSVALWRDTAAAGRLEMFLAGEKKALARAAAEALGRIGDKHAVGVLLSATAGPADRVLEHSLTYALIEIADPAGTAAGLRSASPFTRHATLVALDQMENGGLQVEQVVPLLKSADPVLKQTASWIVSHRPEWGDALAGFFRERLAAKSSNDAERGELQHQLSQLGQAPAIQDLLAATIGDSSASLDARLLALRAMASAGLKETPMRWFGEVTRLLSGGDASLISQAVATARALPLPKQGHAELAAALVNVGRGTGVPPEVRLDALAAAPALGLVEPSLFDFLSANLDGKQPMLMRGAAANVLARAKLTPEQQLSLAGTMRNVGPLEAPKLLPAFERGAHEALGLRLIAALRQSAGLRGLRVDLLRPLLAKYPKSVQEAGIELLTLLNADVAKQAAHLAELLDQTKDGDARRGQALFNSPRAACATCHAIGYQGGRLGPDLTRIGQVRSERDLLEAIVYPSASFVRSYEPFTVTTKGGDDYSGIIRKDGPDEVVLATGPETEQHITRAEIAGMRPGTVSLMPEGLDEVLTKQELADLLAFLQATKW